MRNQSRNPSLSTIPKRSVAFRKGWKIVNRIYRFPDLSELMRIIPASRTPEKVGGVDQAPNQF
jgi:hypothetical protein